MISQLIFMNKMRRVICKSLDSSNDDSATDVVKSNYLLFTYKIEIYLDNN